MTKFYKDTVRKTDNLFIKNIKFLRKKKKLTQAELAIKIGMSLSSLRHIENKEQRVYLSDALLILSYLDIDTIKIDRD